MNTPNASHIIRKPPGGASAKLYSGYAAKALGGGSNVNGIFHYANDEYLDCVTALPPGATVPPGEKITYAIDPNGKAYLIQPYIGTIRATLGSNLLPEGFGDLAVEVGNAATVHRHAFGNSIAVAGTPASGSYSVTVYGVTVNINVNVNNYEQLAAGLALQGISLDPIYAGGATGGATNGMSFGPIINKKIIDQVTIHGAAATVGNKNISWSGPDGDVTTTLPPNTTSTTGVKLINPYGNKAFGDGAIVLAAWLGDAWYIIGGDCSPIYDGDIP